jgi:prepilin-type N-terminal cleavage/methylation domain-containing protein
MLLRKRQSAFTLIEVLLASVISLLLLGALYVAVDMQLRHQQTAREVVQESTLARALMARISTDITQNVDPFLPPQWAIVNGAAPSSSGSGGGGAAGASGSASGSGSSGGATSGGATTGSSSTMSSSSSTGAGNAVVYNVGVQGDSSHLMLCTSRLTRELLQAASPNYVSPDASIVSDLRRVVYWLAGSDSAHGLARMEVKQATSDDAQNMMSNLTDDPAFIMASEVTSLNFSYFDGSAWQDSWDGTTAGPDGVTPVGPPVAIAITVTIASPDGKREKTYRHVVVIPTANGTPASTTATTTNPTG